MADSLTSSIFSIYIHEKLLTSQMIKLGSSRKVGSYGAEARSMERATSSPNGFDSKSV